MASNEEIRIVTAGPEHTPQVLQLLKDEFLPREPLASSIGYTWDELGPHFATKMGAVIEEGYTFVALNSAGRVVGCRISSKKEIEKDKVPEPDYIELSGDTEKVNLLRSIFNALMKGWTKELPDSHVVLEFMLMCVAKDYGQRGIAERLVQKSLALAEELQVDYVYTIATNWRSQRVFDKLSFTTLRVKNYDEFVDENGKPKLTMTDGSTCMKWMVKKIKK